MSSNEDPLLFVIMDGVVKPVDTEVIDQFLNQYIMMDSDIYRRYDKINHVLDLMGGMLNNNQNLEAFVNG